jgi:predicted RNase H-like HicB family nuclease
MAEVAEYGYNVVFERQGDGAYVATVPSLNYISTYGETMDEAREMVKDMLALYLQSLQEDGLEIPEPDAHAPVTERINVALTR